MKAALEKLLFMSTPISVLGSGEGGGIELKIRNVAQELARRGYEIEIVAPQGSVLPGVSVREIAGNLQIAVQNQERHDSVSMPENSVLANMWDYARSVQQDWDLIANFAFDWLPFYITPFFDTAIAHFISMGSMTDALDHVMNQVAQQYPLCIGANTKSQVVTFPFTDKCNLLGSGVDLSLYEFCAVPEKSMIWLGRISPEKALEDAVEAANLAQIPLKIFGKIQDEVYWQKIQDDFPDAPIEYGGFLATKDLQKELGKAQALIMTPRWIEAFGNVAIEALACGVPVIAYNRGGPSEIIKDGKTGFLVEPDNVSGLVAAMAKIEQIERKNCRLQVEREYSAQILGDKFESWFQQVWLKSSQKVAI